MKEFVDFLGGQSPYDNLDADDLDRLAATIEAEYFRAGTVVITAGQPALGNLWVVRTGSLDVLDGERQVDQLVVGDTFGHVSLYSGEPPTLSVVAAADTLVYRIADPRVVVAQPQRLTFQAYGTGMAWQRLSASPTGVRERSMVPVAEYARPLVTASASASVQEVARAIGAAGQSCALITFPEGDPGILTDADFRGALANGTLESQGPVGAIATRPALGIAADTPVASAFLKMVEYGVHHLLVTGTTGTPQGVVRVVDLASIEVRDPLVIRSAVDQATNLSELHSAVARLPQTAVGLFDAAVPALRIGALLSAVGDSILRKLIELAQPEGPTPTSWIVLGSLARREVLPTSDVDTALVWQDSAAGVDLGPKIRADAARVLDAMESVGLHRCADGANADTERFARSVEQWRQATAKWLRDVGQDDALLLSTMLADSRPVTRPDLGEQVTDQLLNRVRSPQFLAALAEYTLASRPPTGFVRDFVVEHSGAHRGQLSLKRGGLRPITSIGRWIAVVTGELRGTTPERLQRAVPAGLLTDDEAQTLTGAYTQIYELLLTQEVEAIRGGIPISTYVAPNDLDSLTRRHLRESFRAIAAVQTRLESRWQLRLPGT